MPSRDPQTEKLKGFGTTIFAEMSALAAATGAINLGQGFPDTDGPAEVLDAAVEAIRSGANQYPPGQGIPELRTAIASVSVARASSSCSYAPTLRRNPSSTTAYTVPSTAAGATISSVESARPVPEVTGR